MDEFWILLLLAFFITNSLDKAESVQLEELPLQTFDELFVEELWDKDEAEDLNTPAPTNFGQNAHHQIDRQNTQIGQIEPNSTDQLGQNTNSTDQLEQIKPNSTDQNPSLTESDKRKIIDKFQAMKDEFKQKGKYSKKEWTQIENKVAKHLKGNRTKIYEWKKEFDISSKKTNNEHKYLVEKFDQMKAKLKLDGFKNSYPNQINQIVAKELGITFRTISNWKRKLGKSTPKHKHTHSKQKELMKRYYAIKDENPKNSDKEIVKMIKIGLRTLFNWKKQFKRQQLHPNSVDGHSVEENAAANVQEIGHSNSGSI